MASKTAVAGMDNPGERRKDAPDRRQMLGLRSNGSRPGGQPASRRPLGPQDFADWPVPVARVTVDRDTTFVCSPERGGYTAEEFFALPVGDRTELWDGVVAIRPELTPEYRAVVDGLYKDLSERCPKGLIPFQGRLDVQVEPHTVLRPDIQVLSEDGDDPPRLAVDVLPGRDAWFRRCQLDVKRHGYFMAGIASLWVVDPDFRSVAVYELRYQKRGNFTCQEICQKGEWNHWGLWEKTR